MKVRATDASYKRKIKIAELGRIASPHEEFEVSKERFAVLTGKNKFHTVFVTKVEEQEPVVEEVEPLVRKVVPETPEEPKEEQEFPIPEIVEDPVIPNPVDPTTQPKKNKKKKKENLGGEVIEVPVDPTLKDK